VFLLFFIQPTTFGSYHSKKARTSGRLIHNSGRKLSRQCPAVLEIRQKNAGHSARSVRINPPEHEPFFNTSDASSKEYQSYNPHMTFD
jgi:hypothetical protein